MNGPRSNSCAVVGQHRLGGPDYLQNILVGQPPSSSFPSRGEPTTNTNENVGRAEPRSAPAPTATTITPTCFDKVPMALKKLVRLAVSAFHGTEQGIVVDYLIHYPCLREDHLADVLRLERKHLRAIVAPLKADHVIKAQMRLVTSAGGSGADTEAALSGIAGQRQHYQQQYYYYYVDYGAAANALRYRLDRMGEALERDEARASTRSTFRCTGLGCGSTYTDLDVDLLFDAPTGDLFCHVCSSLVVLEGEATVPTIPVSGSTAPAAATKREARKTITLFNTQLEPIFAMLRKVENVVLAPHLAKPEPMEVDVNDLMNAAMRGSLTGSLHPNGLGGDGEDGRRLWKNDARNYGLNGKVEYDWYKTGITINIQSSTQSSSSSTNDGSNASLHNRSNKFSSPSTSTNPGSNVSRGKWAQRKQMPSWLSLNSSNILRDYNSKILGIRDEGDGQGSTEQTSLQNSPNKDHRNKRGHHHHNHNHHSSSSSAKKISRHSHSGGGINGDQSSGISASDVVSPWGTNYRYKRNAANSTTADGGNENVEEVISRTLLIYESKGSNAKDASEAVTATAQSSLPNNLDPDDVDKYGAMDLYNPNDDYTGYNGMERDKSIGHGHQNYHSDESSMHHQNISSITEYVTPSLDIGGSRIPLTDIDTGWLAKMTEPEKALYFELCKNQFDLTYDT